MKVIKSNGTFEEYSSEKIKQNIIDTCNTIGEKIEDSIIDKIFDDLILYENIKTLDIRKQVEYLLMPINKKVAKKYIEIFGKTNENKIKYDFIRNYIEATNASTGSKFDSNANVSNKNVVTLGQELYKENNIKLNRWLLSEKIKTNFSKKLAREYISDLESHRIYKHDETAIPGMPYCVSISMYPFLVDGLTKLGGVSKKPTDLKSFCGEFINLVYSVSSQFAGAVSTPEFFMYMDYFLRKDYGDDYIERLSDVVDLSAKKRTIETVIENCFQQVVHSMNMPAGNRGYQCVREDTTQLSTPNGYKYLNELKEGDECYVWKDGNVAIEPIKKLNVYDFDGDLLQFKGRNYQQTVTESHRVLYKKPNSNNYDIKEAKSLFGDLKLSLPIASNGVLRDDFAISDELLKLCVITLLSGIIENVEEGNINSGKISFVKVKNDWGYVEIPKLLDSLGIGYVEKYVNLANSNEVISIEIPKIESQIILRQIHHTRKEIPKFFKLLSKRQIDIVVDIWSKCDITDSLTQSGLIMNGVNENNNEFKLICYNKKIQETLQEILSIGGYGTEACRLKCNTFDGLSETFVNYVKVFKQRDENILEYNKINYSGRVWCPTTDAGIVIFREENKIPYFSGNSVFWNVGYFDKFYFEGVFDEFVFPDGTKPKWETLSWLQKKFMKWFNEERTKYVLTFPVETMALLTDEKDVLDPEYRDFVSEMWADGHSFFCYLSDSPDSLSSCCFSKNTKILWKSSTSGVNLTTLEELHNTSWELNKKNLRIFHNGSWIFGKTIKLPNRKMYKVVTENNKEFVMTDNHLNVTFDGEKTTDSLTTEDYLMFNTQVLSPVHENDEHLTYDMGFVVGAFLGDSSFGSEINGTIYETNFSQNSKKYEKMMSHIDATLEQIGSNGKSTLKSVCDNVYSVRVSSKELVALIQRWTKWKRGTYSYNKKLNLDCLLQSVEFRKGILDGWYNTDGGDSNRCYTVSKELADDMECLITSLGMNSILNISDKVDEKSVIRGIEFNQNYPLYCVRWYSMDNNRKNKDKNTIWKKKNNSTYFKIKNIEIIDYNDDVYCIECENEEEPYFTLPSGLITHNCRLRNDINKNKTHNATTHQFSMGTASVATGSKSVMTININQIIQDSVNNTNNQIFDYLPSDVIGLYKNNKEIYLKNIKSDLSKITQRIHKYQLAFNEIIKDFLEFKMLDVYSAGFINLKQQYLTIGVNGLTDAAEYLGIEISDNPEYEEFVNTILETINICNANAKTKDLMYNTEFVPGESLSSKNYNWNKKAGYYVSPKHNMYSSYFYNPEDEGLSIIDKLKLHGKKYVKYLDGGSACHVNINEHLTKEQYQQLLKTAIHYGTNYFTFNCKNTVCNDCGYISKDTLDKCPKCGSVNLDYLTRIIGYLKRVSSFNELRQLEESKRSYTGHDKIL